MRKASVKFTVWILTALLLGALPPAGAATTGTFSVKAILPDNQVSSRNTYFDLQVEPGAHQTLQVVVTNSGDSEMTATVEVNAASTGRNGLITYTEPQGDTGTVSVEEIVEVSQPRVTVPAHGAETVELELEMPEEPVEGVVLGGVVVTRQEDRREEDTDHSGGITLNNQISYVIGLKLSGGEAEEPEQDFLLTGVGADLVNYHPAVVFSIENPVATIVKEMEVDAQVYQQGGRTPMHTLSLEDVEMAPNSTGQFVVDWASQAIDRGDYVLNLTARHGGETWTWEQPFTIGGEAGEINNGAVGITRNTTWVYVLIAVLAVIAAVVIRRAYVTRKKREQ